MNSAKHLGHDGTCTCSSTGIGACNANTFHLTLIISVSIASKALPRTNVTSSSGGWTSWPSNNSKRSCQGIICLHHRKSFRNMSDWVTKCVVN